MRGTVDRVGIMNGQLWIIDLKCVQRLYPGFAVQTAGYELLLPKPGVPPFKYTCRRFRRMTQICSVRTSHTRNTI